MAVDRVAKVLVAVHKESAPRFLALLQRQGVLHIVKTEETESAAPEPAGAGPQGRPSETVARLEQDFRRLADAIEFLGAGVKKKGGLLGSDKVSMSRSDFDAVAAQYDPAQDLERAGRLAREIEELKSRERTLELELKRLEPWLALEHSPAEFTKLGSVTVTLGLFADASELDRALELLADRPVRVQRIGEGEAGIAVLVASARDAAPEVGRILGTCRFEAVDLANVRDKPARATQTLTAEIRQVGRRREALKQELAALSAEVPKMKVAADKVATTREREAARAGLAETRAVTLVLGWVRERNFDKLARLVLATETAVLTRVEPEPDEEPPVALVNRPVFRPFEMVLELFSLPSPKELDPTWLIAPFFGVFFALCLTDAGYGIVVAVLSYLLMRKMGKNNKLLGIILIGAVLTLPAGALVGGWFGDVPDRLGIGWLVALKNRVMWFDPVKDPMKFFLLSLGLGYLQMIAGIAFEVADCIRVRSYGDGLLVQLPWFVFLNGLTARVLFAKSLPVWAGGLIVALVLLAVASVVVFTQRSRETRLSQTLWFLLLAPFLLYVGAKFGWLPPEYALAKWFFFAAFVGLYVQAALSMVATRRLKPLPTGLGIAGLALLVLYFAHAAPAWLACAIGLVFFMLSPSGGPVMGKLLWGGYALYGATGYIGVVLSYIRLMALGMCTGGVAVAVNVIAWMVMPVPVVGIVLAAVILVVGHTYNIAVNVLGAFVHSLRLQYVEFFPRFYAGGGEPFVPFREANHYVTVK